MFIVIPQFLVTGLSSIIFAIFDPQKSILHGHHPGNALPVNGTVATSGDVSGQHFDRDEVTAPPNSIAIIFRCVHTLMSIMVSLLTTRLKQVRGRVCHSRFHSMLALS